MTSINPYESPLTESADPPSDSAKSSELHVGGTIFRRYLAANGDWIISVVLALAAGAQMPESDGVLQFVAMTVTWLGYYFATEALFSSTPAKLLAGLVVVQFNGERITARQAFVRTLCRLFEANPIFALPAALCIIFSRRRQRIGDMVAGTVVVSVKEMQRLITPARKVLTTRSHIVGRIGNPSYSERDLLLCRGNGTRPIRRGIP